MKKILSALFIVLVLAASVVSAGAAALTLSNEEHHIIGDLRMVTGTAAVNSGDTLTLGSGTILGVLLSPRNTAAAPASLNYGYRISGSVITINTSADGNTWNFVIIGTGF